MSFLYILNNGYVTLAPYEHIQSYYQNLWPFYQNTQENYIIPQNSIKLPQNDLAQQYNQSSPTVSTITQTQELNHPQNIQNISISKRKMEKNTEKEILSAKKNSQSNIINQFYSFYSSRQKSQKIVERCCLLMNKSLEDSQNILNLFYMTIRFINIKRGRKYVNASMFLKFFSEKQFTDYISQMKDKMDALDCMSLSELCQLCRRCAKYFIKNISINAILTSKRISIVSKEQHLKKRRKIMGSILHHQ